MTSRRIGFIQAFSASFAMERLREIQQNQDREPPPEIILLPEYCIGLENLDEIEYLSARLPYTSIIATLIIGVDENDVRFTRNRAIRFVGENRIPIYNKIQSELPKVDSDMRQENYKDLRDQSMNEFVCICNDKEEAKQVIKPPAVWFILASDKTTPHPVIPPRDFTGHIFFVNGCHDALRSRYYQRIASPFNQSTPLLPVDAEIPPGEERLEIITIP